MKKLETLGLIRGAKPLARYVFDDERQYKKIYRMKDELNLFRLSGQICGRPETIKTRVAKLEAEALEKRGAA